MSPVEVFLAIVKILIVIGFLLSMAALASWADRRQSAMVQDRVGPNRAQVMLPSIAVRFILLVPPTLLGVVALLPVLPIFSAYNMTPQTGVEVLSITTQVAILMGWFTMLVLCGMARRNGPINALEAELAKLDPRSIFYAGVVVHAVGLGVTSLVPLSSSIVAARVSSTILAALFFATGLYTASRVPEGKIPVRLAGTLHAIADTMKMIWKEDFVPKNGDKILHALAPIFAMFPALVTFAVIPFGDTICFGGAQRFEMTWRDLGTVARAMPQNFVCQGHAVRLQVADLNVGILYLFAMGGTGIIEIGRAHV